MKPKRYISLLIALCLSLSLCACGGSTNVPSAPSSTPSDSVGTESETTKPEVPPDATEPDSSTEPEDNKKTEPENGSGTSDNISDNVSGNGDAASDEEEKLVPPVEAPEEPPVNPEHVHKYTNKVVAPTCDKGGYTVHTCDCGDSYTDGETKATGHKYADKVVAPTTSEKGYTLHTCSKCGHSYKDSYVDKLPTETPKPEDKPSQPGNTGDIPASDLEDKKVGTTTINAEDPNNLKKATDPQTGEEIMIYDFRTAPVGTVVSFSEFKKVGSPSENVDHFFEAMRLIYPGISRKGNELHGFKGLAANCYLEDNNYRIDVEYWGASWDGGQVKESKNLVLNSLAYFGGESMGKAVWSMLEEHYNYRSDASKPISKELAAKYGLTVVSEGTFYDGNHLVCGFKVSNGGQIWTIDYSVFPSSLATTNILIPV